MPRTADPDLAERRRRAILDAAKACFLRQGFHQTSMASICGEAAISAGALYRYFASKADIIAAIAEEDRQTVAAILEGALTSGDLTKDLMRLGAALAERLRGDASGRLVAEVLSEATRDPALAQRLRAVDEDARQRLASALRRAQRHGQAAPGLDPAAGARLIFAALDGLLIRAALSGASDPAAALQDFRVLVERLLSPPDPLGAETPAETRP